MVKEKSEVNQDVKRKNLTFFLLIFPSLILALLPWDINGNVIYALTLKILVLLFQYYVAKNFVESIYT